MSLLKCARLCSSEPMASHRKGVAGWGAYSTSKAAMNSIARYVAPLRQDTKELELIVCAQDSGV